MEVQGDRQALPSRPHRARVFKGATIIISLSKSEIACIVRNQHEGGAELKVPPEANVPARFTLYVPVDGVAYEAIFRWRRNERVGVQFIREMPKPRHHYG
jgi:hypothetical protein